MLSKGMERNRITALALAKNGQGIALGDVRWSNTKVLKLARQFRQRNTSIIGGGGGGGG